MARFGRVGIEGVPALVYVIAALILWARWQMCSGWTWLCSTPLLESLTGPWTRWLRSSEALGPLGPRVFVLAAIALNAWIILRVARVYAWMIHGSRRRFPWVAGATCGLVYALVALFVFVDEAGCATFACDLGVVLLALPWSYVTGVRVYGWGAVAALLMLALNAVIVYAVSFWAAWAWARRGSPNHSASGV
jgi:hypothetical protein